MENLTNLIDSWNHVEPWKSNSNFNNKNIPLQQLRCQDKSLGVSVSCPTKLSLSSSSVNWMILGESNEYPAAQVRIAPPSSDALGALSIGIVIDDGFAVTCDSVEDALDKRKLAAAQEVSMAGGRLNVLKSEVIKNNNNGGGRKTEALGEWEMVSNSPGFPTLLVREKVHLWNGMSVAVSVVAPKENVPQADFDLVFQVVTSTLNIDHTSLRLLERQQQRLLVVSHPMNCMINLPFARRLILADGSSSRAFENHAAPALPGTVIVRCINPLTDISLSIIALPTQDLGGDDENNNNNKTAHYIRQTRAQFHDGTSIAKIVEEGDDDEVDEFQQILTFTSPAVGVNHGRLCCAARPIPPRLGADPRMFLVLVASRLFDSQISGAEELVDRILTPELVKMVSPKNVFVSSLPFEIVGKPFKPSESKKEIKVALTGKTETTTQIPPPACRYFVLDSPSSSSGKNNNNNNNNIQINSFSSIQSGSAVELHMACFGAANGEYSCFLTRCIFGDMLTTADGTSPTPVLRMNVMRMVKNKSIESVLNHAKYTAASIDPMATTVMESKNGSYDVLMGTPSEECSRMSGGVKNGFHIGRNVAGDGASCVFCIFVVIMGEAEQHMMNQIQQ
jgi:hypothetical protein